MGLCMAVTEMHPMNPLSLQAEYEPPGEYEPKAGHGHPESSTEGVHPLAGFLTSRGTPDWSSSTLTGQSALTAVRSQLPHVTGGIQSLAG